MAKVWLRWTLFYSSLLIATFVFFQNCGPAKLSGGSDSGSGAANSASTTIGTKVDLNSLMKSPQEPTLNVLFPSATTTNEYDYAIDAPIIENVVLKNNDFSRIEWVHGPTSTVVAVGDAFNQSKFSSDMLGSYFIIGYRGETSFLISQFRLSNKGATTLNANSVGAIQLSQKVISSDSQNEVVLVTVDAPTVDISSVHIEAKTKGYSYDGRRAVLINKKLSESVDVEFRVSDTSGQTATKLLTLPTKSTPPPSTSTPITEILQLSAPNQTVQAGKIINIDLKFNAVPMPEDYKIFVAFVNSNGTEAPFSGSSLPAIGTSKWPTGMMTHTISFVVPANTPVGSYSIRAGMFRNLPSPNDTRISLQPGPGVIADNVFRYAVGTLNVTAPVTQVMQLTQPSLAIAAGQTLNLTVKFNAFPMAADYLVFIHLVDTSGVQHSDMNGGGAPPVSTTIWNGAINYQSSIAIPAAAPKGTYTIRVGLYKNIAPYLDRATLDMGPGVTVDAQNRYTIGTLTIQ